MFLDVSFAATLFFTPGVLALSSRSGFCVTRRRKAHQPQVSNRRSQTPRAVSNTRYNGVWAGAVCEQSSGTFTSVTGTFIVPTISGASGASGSIAVSIDSYTNATLYTGVYFTVSSSGQPTYAAAWYDSYPAPPYDFTGMSISAGDVIKLKLTTTSATSVTATIENLTNGQNVSTCLKSLTPLPCQNVGWIVQGYGVGDSLVPLANFGTVTFMDAKVTGTGNYSPSSATTFDIKQDMQVLTSTSTDGSCVTIQYV